MEKTTVSVLRDGTLREYTWRRVQHGTWSSIILVARDGKDATNKWGGHTTKNVGSNKYIDKLWRKL